MKKNSKPLVGNKGSSNDEVIQVIVKIGVKDECYKWLKDIPPRYRTWEILKLLNHTDQNHLKI